MLRSGNGTKRQRSEVEGGAANPWSAIFQEQRTKNQELIMRYRRGDGVVDDFYFSYTVSGAWILTDGVIDGVKT